MEMKRPARATRGRPRTFDADDALDRALKVFWRKGYQGASLPNLTRAMGINRPSLYAAFGNKQSLFCKALERYNDQNAAYLRHALAAPTAREVARRILHGAINLQTNPHNPRGCLTVRGSLSCADSRIIHKHLASHRAATEAAITQRFQRAVAEGDLPQTTSPQDLTRYLSTILQGLSIQSTSGASRAQLLRIANTALQAFPPHTRRKGQTVS
jgi:AcrR family transcriptional regulator